MEIVLIQGSENTGKTTLCKMIEDCLIDSGFREEVRESRPTCGYEQDFTAIYRKDKCTVIINSESEKGGFDRFSEIYENNLPYDECTIIITAIRPKAINPNLHNWIRRVYEKQSIRKEHLIDLDMEWSKNIGIDFCVFVKETLKDNGYIILREIMSELRCKIEINCKSIIEKVK